MVFLRSFLSIFIVFSTLTLTRNGSITDEVLGIQGHTFIGNDSVFDNGTKYPNMACFSSGESVRSGVRNISACKYAVRSFNEPLIFMIPKFAGLELLRLYHIHTSI